MGRAAQAAGGVSAATTLHLARSVHHREEKKKWESDE